GIPIIAIMKESLMAVTIDGLYGIVNGTCNYILTEMAAQKANFKDMLLLAQKKGYAEADPTFDIDGTDSFHKLVILTMLAFGITPPTSGSGHRGAAHGGVAVEGITKIEWVDIFYAKMFGFVIKLLAYGRQTNEHLSLGVAPMLVPDNHSIAHVDGALNAIDITSPAHGSLLFVGKGAGGPPTAAAVLSDMMKAASSHPNHQATGYQPPFIRPFQQLQQNQLSLTNPDEEYGRFYLRLTVDDKIGVLASAGGILRDEDISIEKLHQHDDKPVHIVFITHPTKAAAIKKAVAKIKKLEAVLDEPCLIRLMGHR
ncbi:MAG: homoserine dehydrogenase, partial [Alphaproteobacteria bacterium]|nr:homoserine dehydrogenase [Alphaproteobacteria bacterium]